jgi:hypothetical protein
VPIVLTDVDPDFSGHLTELLTRAGEGALAA